jgi:hypothetical protein
MKQGYTNCRHRLPSRPARYVYTPYIHCTNNGLGCRRVYYVNYFNKKKNRNSRYVYIYCTYIVFTNFGGMWNASWNAKLSKTLKNVHIMYKLCIYIICSLVERRGALYILYTYSYLVLQGTFISTDLLILYRQVYYHCIYSLYSVSIQVLTSKSY